MSDVEKSLPIDFEGLFENAPCGYLVANPSGRIIGANSTFLKWTGRERSEVEDRRFQELLNIPGKIYYETHFAPLLRMQGYFHEVALDLTGPEGRSIPVLVNADEQRDDAGDVRQILITIFDATDRRRYEGELLAARRAAENASAKLRELTSDLERRVAVAIEERLLAEDALRQAQKMEAIGQLTGGVAHDFNNLLTIILGGVEMVLKQASALPSGPERDKILRSANMSAHGARRAATLTARLLAFARRQPLDPKPLDVNRLLTGLAELLQRTLGETIALETVVGAGLWKTLVDPGELENALVNLAVNARDAMPNGGKLTIETTNAFLDCNYVSSIPEPVEEGRYVLICVSDTGLGMDAETLARVFEPFFTTKPSGKGTGLGLSQVYGFVRQTGGHVSIYSEIGIGTSIKLYLPQCTDGIPENNEAEQRISEGVYGGTETVLYVEDDPDLRDFGAGLLHELGYNVLIAADGRTALNYLDSGHKPDVLFTDVVLGGNLTGRAVADEAVRRLPELKVLYTTGYTQNAIVHNGRLDPGVNLIGKPFTFEELAATLRRVLDETRFH